MLADMENGYGRMLPLVTWVWVQEKLDSYLGNTGGLRVNLRFIPFFSVLCSSFTAEPFTVNAHMHIISLNVFLPVRSISDKKFSVYSGALQGVLSGKSSSWGGSAPRPEATGYGLVNICPWQPC